MLHMPDPKKDHPLVQDARKMLHLSQMLMIFSAECPAKDKPLLSSIVAEVVQNLDAINPEKR